MKVFDKNGKELEAEIEYGGDACDSYIGSATYVESGVEADEDLCEWLTQAYADEIFEGWSEHQICRAEHYADLAADR